MIAVDTKIVVRLLTQDDEVQYQKGVLLMQNLERATPEGVTTNVRIIKLIDH